eukprot:COSAG04_NODE_19841_length_407_cov_0.600649_2_plen_30_part_01
MRELPQRRPVTERRKIQLRLRVQVLSLRML